MALKLRKNRNKDLVSLMCLQNILKYLATYYNEYKHQTIMKLVKKFKCFKIQMKLQRFLRRIGPYKETRDKKRITK